MAAPQHLNSAVGGYPLTEEVRAGLEEISIKIHDVRDTPPPNTNAAAEAREEYSILNQQYPARIETITSGFVPPPNTGARAETVREAITAIDHIERQISDLKADIKAIIETQIVADLGIKKRDFALMRKLYAIDSGERDTLFDAIRECFDALGCGEQLDWLGALDREAPTKKDASAEA